MTRIGGLETCHEVNLGQCECNSWGNEYVVSTGGYVTISQGEPIATDGLTFSIILVRKVGDIRWARGIDTPERPSILPLFKSREVNVTSEPALLKWDSKFGVINMIIIQHSYQDCKIIMAI